MGRYMSSRSYQIEKIERHTTKAVHLGFRETLLGFRQTLLGCVAITIAQMRAGKCILLCEPQACLQVRREIAIQLCRGKTGTLRSTGVSATL